MKRLIIIGLSIIMLVAPVCSVSAQETASTVTAVVDKDCGAYKIKVFNDNNAPVFRSKMSQTDVRTAVATEDEKSLVDNNGYTLTAIISVTPIATTVSNSISMDITLDTTLADASGTVTKTNNLTETASPIQLSFAAPDNVINVNGQLTISDYKLTRTHNGLTDTIPVTYDSTTRTFTFKTDKFSTYSFFYEFANSIVPAISTDTTQDSAGTVDDHKDDSNNGGSDVTPTPPVVASPISPAPSPSPPRTTRRLWCLQIPVLGG